MKVIKENLNNSAFTLVESAGLSRIWQYTHNNVDFAIIGTQDKDTKEDRTDELRSMLSKLRSNNNKITWRILKGTYTYDNGEQGEENSFLINNVSKEEASKMMNAINQESIIWKDDSYFGFLLPDGDEDGEFSKDDKNMGFNSEDVRNFGSRLDSKHNKGQGFTFKMESLVAEKSMSSVRNLSGKNKLINKNLFTIRCKMNND